MSLRSRAGLVAATAAVTVAAGSAVAETPPQPLFASSGMIRLTLAGPIMSLANEPLGVERPVAGTLTLQGAAPETLAVAVSPRGLTRRREENCRFPPLRVEFTEKPAETSLFRGQKDLKLVTHCQSPASFQKHVLLEYAAYRIYNLITPASFNVRLAAIDYTDSGGRPIISRIGFFIEDVDDVARRNGLRELETKEQMPVARLSPSAAARFALFQILIGNFDWSMRAPTPGDECCHNSKLIGAVGATADLAPVPYDFDQAGLVDAPYAVRASDIQHATVGERRYRGFCAHDAHAQAVAADLLTRRPQLLAVFDETPQLEETTRLKAAAYVRVFFDRIDSPAKVAKLLQTCVG